MSEQNKMEELERRMAILEENLGRFMKHRTLRLRGLIIEDEHGQERILLGAPVPDIEGRIRRDLTTSLIFLDEKGIDRLVVGHVPDPLIKGQIQERSPAVGMAFNGHDGNERGGIGVFDNGVAGLAFDYLSGKEAVGMGVIPEKGAFIEVNHETNKVEELMIGFIDGKPLVKLAAPGSECEDPDSDLQGRCNP